MDSLAKRKRTLGKKTKVKTGCATCRIRRIKCDEAKPCCRKCVDTGRACEGYESPFRLVTVSSVPRKKKPAAGQPGQDGHSIQTTHSAIPTLGRFPLQPAVAEITAQDILVLNRCFSTKTMFNVTLDCDEEAKQILAASLTDPAVRHAVSSLRALREHLETASEDASSLASAAQPPLSPNGASYYHYGIQQYCEALGGLVSSLSLAGAHGLTSTLLCCQIFISIEQVQGNYAAMAQHMVRGLDIMREHGARPYFDTASANKLVMPTQRIPLLDVFIIKLFAAPCKFAEPGAAPTADLASSHPRGVGASRPLRTIAPNMRTKLTGIAALTLEFLDTVAKVESARHARRMRSERAFLLQSLEAWLAELEEHFHAADAGPGSGPGPISLCFLRLFQQALHIVLIGTLDSSADLDAQLRSESDRFQRAASILTTRIQAFKQ